MYNNRQNKGELAKAELALEEAEMKHELVKSKLEERRAEREALDNLLERAGAAGNVDELIVLQSRRSSLEKTVMDLSISEKACLHRVESARRYLYKLYVRLEKLRQEAASLEEAEPRQLVRVRMQIEAIAGAE
ncbi:MAG: hypothetical protein L0229_19700 [Blastocatellia bacterium]|nr:hypothetical protein [Blastocatellia bacterium]